MAGPLGPDGAPGEWRAIHPQPPHGSAATFRDLNAGREYVKAHALESRAHPPNAGAPVGDAGPPISRAPV